MHQYFRKMSLDKIAVSVDIASLSDSDINNLIASNRNFKFIKSSTERGKLYTVYYTKADLMKFLGLYNKTDKPLATNLAKTLLFMNNCDRYLDTACTELLISNGRYAELFYGKEGVYHIECLDLHNILYELVVTVINARLNFYKSKKSV